MRRITNHAIKHVSYQVSWHALAGSDSNMQVRRKSCWLSALQQLVSLGEQAVLHYLCYITFLNCGYIMLHQAVQSWSVWGTSHVTLWAKGLVIGQWYLDICTTIVAYYATGIWVRFPRTGKMSNMWHFFLIFDALLWPNGWIFSSFLNCSEEIMSVRP